jgi:hypothetical protein
MNRFAVFVLLSVASVACKSKNSKKAEVPAASFFPVADYIKGELSRLDSSKFPITKIESSNGLADTTVINNSEVRRYASDFLTLPDLSSPVLKNDYDVTHLYDDLQEAFVFTYTTKESHPVQQENVTVEPKPNASGKNDIKSIYVSLVQDSIGSPRKKILLWTAGKGFLVTTITQPSNGTEQIRTVQVNWIGNDARKTEK